MATVGINSSIDSIDNKMPIRCYLNDLNLIFN